VGGLFLLGLATTLAYFLLANDTDVSKTLTELVGGRDFDGVRQRNRG